ncbi:MAG: CvpA family protein [Candidatus Cloacimonadota bacterium]|nr:CvpA family protein [Candidatus Cloacimonadota bacterium]
MEASNIIDVIFAIFLFIFFFIHLRKGLVASVLHLAGLVITVLLVYHIGHSVKDMIVTKLNLSNTLALIIAYILIILTVMLITKIIIIIINRVMKFLHLNTLNRILGGLFGLINGILVISILLIIVDISPFLKFARPDINKSYIVQVTRKATGIAKEKIPQLHEEEEKLKNIIPQ